jgi:hypothetical protein
MILINRQPPWLGEQDPLGLVGEGLELFCRWTPQRVRAVEAPTPHGDVPRGAGLVAAVLALSRVRARSVRVLPFRPSYCATIPGDSLPGPAYNTPHHYPAPLHVVSGSMLSRAMMTFLRSRWVTF